MAEEAYGIIDLMFLQLCLVASLVAAATAYSYKLGGCPTVEPLPEFEMSKFLGKWYVMQKTSTGSRCLTYNFTNSSEPQEYDVEQVSEHPILGLASVDNKYHYTGHLTVPSLDTPAEMVVKFPLNVAGTASYTVFATDYETYGAIFTCQKLAFFHRQSATILSRNKTLENVYLDEIRDKLSAFGVDLNDLSVIAQTNCPSEEDEPKVKISIDDETFDIAGKVKKVWEELGDGIVSLKKKLYNAVVRKSDEGDEEIIDNKKNWSCGMAAIAKSLSRINRSSHKIKLYC